jgi:signal transduction histidine kinase
MVEGLLMMARSEGTIPELVAVDVAALADERAATWAPFAEERDVRLVTAVPTGLTAMAAPSALEQIIDNYIDNAVGAARPGDTILVSARKVADRIEVHVIDEGPGIDPGQVHRAFDRFWRAADAPQGGSGIGLAIVRHLAELSGGSAEIHNRTDRSGLDASVVLPAAG